MTRQPENNTAQSRIHAKNRQPRLLYGTYNHKRNNNRIIVKIYRNHVHQYEYKNSFFPLRNIKLARTSLFRELILESRKARHALHYYFVIQLRDTSPDISQYIKVPG